MPCLRKPKKCASAKVPERDSCGSLGLNSGQPDPFKYEPSFVSDHAPIPDTANFPIFQDESVPLHDEFGFSQVRGIEKTIIAIPTEFDFNDDLDNNQPSKEDSKSRY
jgi:hypothetical protein